MVYSVEEVAKYFLRKSSPGTIWAIDPLKLQKLTFYGEAYYLAISGGTHERLINDCEFEAWVHGPVCRKLWQKYSNYGYDDIPTYVGKTELDEDEFATFVLDFVWNKYGHESGKTLEMRTHNEDPWKNARGNKSPQSRSRSIISIENMFDFYKDEININYM
ncbi:Panacea domain-containing protein [Desertibacillus haloalkaliphilus]|uniref:Panacea domain-containing protein n=1 Tax=Desertibacillus haloalkaliphilus TaxID=1328930 RepID=UPI001C276C83|nr:type II toxin-antitoxin system antitoxin SocA domain-containing protein [Desertibacillus haloalkaliphilus]MBU8908464.1 DUF4065 domain-containing protein [Desertibacillus haloalkaliphilus]